MNSPLFLLIALGLTLSFLLSGMEAGVFALSRVRRGEDRAEHDCAGERQRSDDLKHEKPLLRGSDAARHRVAAVALTFGERLANRLKVREFRVEVALSTLCTMACLMRHRVKGQPSGCF